MTHAYVLMCIADLKRRSKRARRRVLVCGSVALLWTIYRYHDIGPVIAVISITAMIYGLLTVDCEATELEILEQAGVPIRKSDWEQP